MSVDRKYKRVSFRKISDQIFRKTENLLLGHSICCKWNSSLRRINVLVSICTNHLVQLTVNIKDEFVFENFVCVDVFCE